MDEHDDDWMDGSKEPFEPAAGFIFCFCCRGEIRIDDSYPHPSVEGEICEMCYRDLVEGMEEFECE